MQGQESPTVLAASDDVALLDEIVRHVEEIPDWKLVSSPGSVESMLASVDAHWPDAVILSDGLARQLARSGSAPIDASAVVVGRKEDASALKAALKIGARGFVLWPKESAQLRGLVERNWAPHESRKSSRGSIYSVWSPKGGSGTSLIAAHLTAGLHKCTGDCTLVDLDIDNADQTTILGAKAEGSGMAGLIRVSHEMSPSLVASACWTHPGGFKAVLASGPSTQGANSGLAKGPEIVRVLDAIRETAAHVVADLPSGINEVSLPVIEQSTRVLLVVTGDLLSLRRAGEALAFIRAAGLSDSNLVLIANQMGPASVSAKDISATLGIKVAQKIKADVAVYRAANRGEICSATVSGLGKLARNLSRSAEPPAPNRAGRFNLRRR